MNKGELVAAVGAKLQCNKAEAGKAVDAVLASITEGVRESDKVTVPGFGTFKKVHRKARTGRNPITKEPIPIPASVTMSFSASATIKNGMH